MTINTDGNAHALAQYERKQDALQRLDDLMDEIATEIHDDPDRLAQLIDEWPGLSPEDAVDEEVRRIIAERNCDALESQTFTTHRRSF